MAKIFKCMCVSCDKKDHLQARTVESNGILYYVLVCEKCAAFIDETKQGDKT